MNQWANLHGHHNLCWAGSEVFVFHQYTCYSKRERWSSVSDWYQFRKEPEQHRGEKKESNQKLTLGVPRPIPIVKCKITPIESSIFWGIQGYQEEEEEENLRLTVITCPAPSVNSNGLDKPKWRDTNDFGQDSINYLPLRQKKTVTDSFLSRDESNLLPSAWSVPV